MRGDLGETPEFAKKVGLPGRTEKRGLGWKVVWEVVKTTYRMLFPADTTRRLPFLTLQQTKGFLQRPNQRSLRLWDPGRYSGGLQCDATLDEGITSFINKGVCAFWWVFRILAASLLPPLRRLGIPLPENASSPKRKEIRILGFEEVLMEKLGCHIVASCQIRLLHSMYESRTSGQHFKASV